MCYRFGWTVAATAPRFQVDAKTVRKWRDRFLEGGQAAVAAGGRVGSSREQRLEIEIGELTFALGEAHMELRLWRKGGVLYPASKSSKRHRSTSA